MAKNFPHPEPRHSPHFLLYCSYKASNCFENREQQHSHPQTSRDCTATPGLFCTIIWEMTSASPSHFSSLWKGKGKAAADDYDDLNPTITYRHLLSSNMGVKDPLRVVALWYVCLQGLRMVSTTRRAHDVWLSLR